MPEPTDLKLYEKIKKKLTKKIPKHSAYRSGLIVKEYKKSFKKKYGSKKPYVGKYTAKKGLSRWFDEKWVNQRGKIGYTYKSDIYRPSKRITNKTPLTHNELSNQDIKKARREKSKKGRVVRFKKKDTSSQKGGIRENIVFKDYPQFTPNLSPRDMFQLGSFGGTYWRPIYSRLTKKHYKNMHKKYPKKWWKGIPESHLSQKNYDVTLNKYKVKVGTTLEFWENKKWIHKENPYGWVHWYCDFYNGRRGPDDARQISRWEKLAGKKGRFMRFLVTQILKKKGKWNDESISPKIRQVLQHWGYALTKKDFDNEVKRRKSN
jgi:hypothetical protein